MFVSPVNENITFLGRAEGVIKKAWENYTIYEDGVFYALFGTGIKGENNPSGYAIAIDAAKSADGVHWEFISQNAIPIPGAHAGFGIKKIGEWFYYYPTCSNSEKGVHFKVYRTKDFVTFEHMGDKFDVLPDRRYYHERWDEVYIIKDADEEDWQTEYLDYILAVKTVSSCDEAAAHINKYGTKHSEAILTYDLKAAEKFRAQVDAACVYVNASIRFTDGGEFGFGAELGISTQKFHTRGPMGLEALTTIKYLVTGSGQIRS